MRPGHCSPKLLMACCCLVVLVMLRSRFEARSKLVRRNALFLHLPPSPAPSTHPRVAFLVPPLFYFQPAALRRKLVCGMQKATTLALLRQMLGSGEEFRDGQWEAIHLAANQRRRLLVVQRTGWGKSVVYFLADKNIRAPSERVHPR